jgi:hypothetical protein
MKRLFSIVFVLLLFSACENKSKTVMPSRLLTEQEMIAIMYYVQILEADMNYRKSNGKMIGDMPKEYYQQLFEHYGITDSIFNQNMRYYTQDPATLERIMDSVMERLTSSVPQQSDH